MAVLMIKNDKGEWESVPFFMAPSKGVNAIDLANAPEVESLENLPDDSPAAVKYNGEIYLKVEE